MPISSALAKSFCLSGLSFASHDIVAAEVSRPSSVFAADLDGDADLDVLCDNEPDTESDTETDADVDGLAEEVVAALGEEVQGGACIVAQLTGYLRESKGGTEIVGEDVIRIRCTGN